MSGLLVKVWSNALSKAFVRRAGWVGLALVAVALVVWLLAPPANGGSERHAALERGAELPLTLSPLLAEARFDRPIAVLSVPGEAAFLVAEAGGRVWRFSTDTTPASRILYLDLSDRISTRNTPADGGGHLGGLTSIVLDPEYADNGRLFAALEPAGVPGASPRTIVVALHRATDDPRRAASRSIQPLLELPGQPSPVELCFGVDGMLLVSVPAIAPHPPGGAPRLRAYDGAVLRLDVHQDGRAVAAPDNPYVGARRALPEIWSTGLRVPRGLAVSAPSGIAYVTDRTPDGRVRLLPLQRGQHWHEAASPLGLSPADTPPDGSPAEARATVAAPTEWAGTQRGGAIIRGAHAGGAPARPGSGSVYAFVRAQPGTSETLRGVILAGPLAGHVEVLARLDAPGFRLLAGSAAGATALYLASPDGVLFRAAPTAAR